MEARQTKAMEYKGYAVRWLPYKDVPDVTLVVVEGDVDGVLYTPMRIVENSTSLEPDGTPSREILDDAISRIESVRAMSPEKHRRFYRICCGSY